MSVNVYLQGVKMELDGKKINFMGDSITEGYGASGKDRIFSSLIAVDTGAVCRNYGIAGTRISRQRKPSADPDWDRDFCSRVTEMDADADIVIVLGGTNDFGHGDAPFGSFEDKTSDTFRGALNVLYTSLIERYPGKIIVIATPLHRCDEEWRRPDSGADLRAYVGAIRKAAEYYSLPVLDLWAMSGLQPNLPVIQEKFMPDKLHPNDAGHRIIADRIIGCLKML